jgi:opacity protein-like surface antigen
MKKWCFSFFLFLVPSVLMAQFEVGASAGASLSSTNQDVGNYDYRTLAGLYPEVQAGYLFNDYLRADMGLGFESLGFKVKPQNEGTFNVRLRYFSVPVYATFQYPVIPKLSVGLLAGLHFNLINSESASYPFEKDFQQLDNTVGLLCGVMARYQLTDVLSLGFQYRYNADLTDVDNSGDLGRLRYHTFQIGIFYRLKSGKAVTAPVGAPLTPSDTTPAIRWQKWN